ncbi:MAG: hypothetical protein Q9163_005932 [Psora crenata]
MALRTISARNAAALDKDLMSVGAFSLDQLMELAGLSVSQAVYRVHPPSAGKKVLIACGPGNNGSFPIHNLFKCLTQRLFSLGGDGLVAARHLFHYGYQPTVFYPKPTGSEIYERLANQLRNLDVPFTEDFEGSLKASSHVVDAIFGFSFSGDVRDPFKSVIGALETTKVPVLSVDAPSSWSIEDGPPKEGPGAKFQPATLVSLTAPKPLVKHFRGTHFVGGRFLPPSVAEKYELDMPKYQGIDQIVEVGPAEREEQKEKIIGLAERQTFSCGNHLLSELTDQLFNPVAKPRVFTALVNLALRARVIAGRKGLGSPPRKPRLFQTSGIATHAHSHHASLLSILPSNIDKASADYKENTAEMNKLMGRMQSLHRKIEEGGPANAKEKHIARGKMLPRDRVTALIDPGAAFLELSPLAGQGLYPGEDVPGGGIITGVSSVAGRQCMIVANDSTYGGTWIKKDDDANERRRVKGGTYYPITVKKHLRAQAIAQENSMSYLENTRPTQLMSSLRVTMYLLGGLRRCKSAPPGGRISRQGSLWADLLQPSKKYMNIFTATYRILTVAVSSAGIPQISVVMGPCTAGGAYVPAMSDESIIVENQGTIFLAGPPLVKAATGEVVTAEELGGGKLHSSISGVTDYLAVDDAHALVLARRCVSNFNSPSAVLPNREPKEPLYDPEELSGIVGTNLKKQIPVHDVIARIVDGSEFSEFKKDYGTTLITGQYWAKDSSDVGNRPITWSLGFAHIHGHQVGVIANNGILFSESSLKGAHFIQLCTQRDIPLVFLQNISGFMVGADAEKGGIAKNGAKLVTAVACAHVPKFTVVFGASAGAGNYGMCGRAYSPRFLWMWPNAKIGVMGSSQLSSVMEMVGKSVDPDLEDRIKRESDAVFSSARLWDDGVIPPAHTRLVLGLGLNAALSGKTSNGEGTRYGVFRM